MKTNIEDLGNVGLVIEDWDISKPFRARTLTVDYSSWIAYVSRKPVPANTDITNTEYWKPIFRLDSELAFDYNSFKEEITKKINTLSLEVNSFLSSMGVGVAVADEFGDSELVGINQKVLTDAINKIWEKIGDITGENTRGIRMTVTPKYFISEDGADVNISANTVEANGIFEYIRFYANGVLIHEEENVEIVNTFTHHTDVTTVIRCEAKIMGIPYFESETIERRPTFFIGAAAEHDYSAILTEEYTYPVKRGHYSVAVDNTGDHIFAIIDKKLEEGYMRLDMNGFEIPMTRTEVTINNTVLAVYESKNGYVADIYDIDVNG